MKRKTRFLKKTVKTFAVFAALLFSANLVLAQCGNYFKINYQVGVNLNIYPFISQAERFDDWTGDGQSDFWNFRRTNNNFLLEVVIFPSKPNGYWDWDNPIIYSTPFSNFNGEYKVADFDADGKTDLYLDHQVYHNTGNNSLTAYPAFTDTGLVSNSTIGFEDINGDHLLDWVYYAFVGSSPNLISEIRYQLQNADGTFGGRTIINSSSYGANKRLGDFNGDGKTDIIYSGVLNNQNVYVLIKNLGGGNFQAGAPVADDLYVYIPPIYGNSVRDFNNDGKDDILSRDAVFYGQADGTFNRVAISTTNDFLLAAELNGDNNLDIIEIGTGFYATHINNGAGAFTRIEYQRNFEIQGNLKFADFSGDGKDDVYAEPSSSSTSVINKNIFGESLLTVKENTCQPFGETKLANFDGNTTTDLTMWNPASGTWSSKNAKWSNGVDPTAKVFNWGLGALGDVPAPGDFDGDGKTDYAVYRSSSGDWYIYKSSDSTWFSFRFGLPGDIAVPNDYDGGGRTDVAVYRPADGNWYIWFSETQQFAAGHFGAAGDKPVPADYDGDGKTDVAIYRPSEGNWYYLKSSDGNYVVLHWGNATDKPLPADYDGDGRADLTIYRDGFWWIWRSFNNAISVVQWGQAGDIPMPVYRNTVSADLMLYRPSNNFWYSFDNRSIAGIAVGGNGDVPVYFALPNN